jgi:hypothetical protein
MVSGLVPKAMVIFLIYGLALCESYISGQINISLTLKGPIGNNGYRHT